MVNTHQIYLMEKIKVKIFNASKNDLPAYESKGAAAFDLRADLENQLWLEPGTRTLIPTGLFLEIPKGYQLEIRSRSGLAYNNGIIVLNAPGTIDSDYRGEVKVLIINHGTQALLIKKGDRIAQGSLSYALEVNWDETKSKDDLSDSVRGDGGFGSTGTSDKEKAASPKDSEVEDAISDLNKDGKIDEKDEDEKGKKSSRKKKNDD